MSSPKNESTEFIGNSDKHENPLTRCDEKSSTEKEQDVSRCVKEDSKDPETCITTETAAKKGHEETAAKKGHEETAAKKGHEETAAKKGHENNGDASVDEIEVISKPECQAGKPRVDSELEMPRIKETVPGEIQEQNNVERIEEKENTGSVASGQRQKDDKLNSAFIDEENASEYVESEGESLSDEDEILSYNTTTQELTVGKISENVLQVFEERSLHKEAVSQSAQVSVGSVDKDCEAGSRTAAVDSDETFIQDSDEAVGRNGVANAVAEEENEDISKYSKMPEVHNAATSTEDSTDVKDEIEYMGPNVSVDERNEDSSTLSKVTRVQNAATSTEVDEGLPPNEKKLTAKQIPTSSKKVAEIIAKYLNTKENIETLDEIDKIVRQLRKSKQSSEEFPPSERSAEDLSNEDLKTWKEFYSHQLQKLATKRKSKICDLDEDAEDIQAIPKKCKLSNAFDIPFEIENWETSCCLEEQFRIAFKETNDGKEKEYKFPLSSGNEQPRKFCKHQIAKIDAMVASVMSLDSYMSQLPDETDNPNNSTEEVYEDTPCCYHTKAQSSSSSNKSKGEVLSGPQESVQEEMIEDSSECSEASDKTRWLRYLTFEGALKSIKNFTLFVSFTGSLMVAMAAGRLFGVDFPVSKSKRNTIRDNSLQEFPTL